MKKDIFDRLLKELNTTVDFEDDWYVAYCDVLGVKGEIKNSSGRPDGYEDVVKKLKSAYSLVYEDMQKYMTELRMPSKIVFFITDRRYRIFSDNIIIAFRCVKDENEFILSGMLSYLANFQAKLLTEYNLLLRGGICRGAVTFEEESSENDMNAKIETISKVKNLVENKDYAALIKAIDSLNETPDFVLGPALISAYELESNCSVYPRIILDESLVDEAFECFKKLDSRNRLTSSKYLIKQDVDGCYYIDYLRRVDTNTVRNKLTEDLNNNTQKDADHLKIRQKIKWVLNKLNEKTSIDSALKNPCRD